MPSRRPGRCHNSPKALGVAGLVWVRMQRVAAWRSILELRRRKAACDIKGFQRSRGRLRAFLKFQGGIVENAVVNHKSWSWFKMHAARRSQLNFKRRIRASQRDNVSLRWA